TLFRVGQEALVVAENQTGAIHVDFEITVHDSTFSMRVQADGAASLPEEGSRGDMALGFLRHRLEAIGGSVTVSHPGHSGIRLIAEVHLDEISATDPQAVGILEVGR
ncbi:MAG TPA: hypothetical protein VGD63_10185, partial [Steroidobacteraceae bacterium]